VFSITVTRRPTGTAQSAKTRLYGTGEEHWTTSGRPDRAVSTPPYPIKMKSSRFVNVSKVSCNQNPRKRKFDQNLMALL